MALTVGGEAVEVSENGKVSSVSAENLSPNETYRVGVSAYVEETYFAESTGAGSTESTETGSMEGEETGIAEGAEGSTAGSGEPAPKRLSPRSITARRKCPPTYSYRSIRN